jgi:hypothetical protein
MATDFAYTFSLLPVLVGLVAFAIVAIKAKNASNTGFLGLGARRIARGYLGALGALLIYAILEAVLGSFARVERGYITAEEMRKLLPGSSIHLFVTFTPFVVFATTVGLLLLRVFVRARLVSLMGALIIAFAYALARAYVIHTEPSNAWCASHLVECASKAFLENLLIAATVAIGFALASGLPVGRSPRFKP